MKRKFYIIFITFGAFLGLLISGAFIYNGHGNGARYAVYGLGFGGLLGFNIAYWMLLYKKSGLVLMRKFRKLGNLRGRDIKEITVAVGGYTSRKETTITDRNNEKGWIHSFVDGGYSVDLLVGADGVCYGITQELIDGKPLKK